MSFSGLAVYNTSVFNEIAADVSDIITQISPFETPLLDRLSQARREATSILHEWQEDTLAPKTFVASTAASTSGTAFGVANALRVQVGAVLKDTNTGEYVQVTAVTANTLVISRGFGGSTAGVLAAGDSLFFVSDAALEGSDVTVDTSVARSRVTNYCQIFKKDIIVSGTMQAVTTYGDAGDEYTYQLGQRMRELARDLESAVIMGKLSGNTIGSASNYRTMKGLWDFLSTNSRSIGATLTTSLVDNSIQDAWSAGGMPNLIIADAAYKRQIDVFNASRAGLSTNGEMSKFQNMVTTYEGAFGQFPVILGRWMPTNSLMVINTHAISVVPLKGRAFRHTMVAPTGDAQKGMVVGEYTLEVRNADGMAKAYG